MEIQYQINNKISAKQFIYLLKESSLAERRPIQDLSCIQGMLDHSNLLITAWQKQQLIGVARSVTDFHYCCYLSDLAVAHEFQGKGIGKQLQQLTLDQLGPKCKLIVIAAPKAKNYYQQLGFKNQPRCWVLEGKIELTTS